MGATLTLIRSASDIGSAVAHRLKRAGLRPILLEGPTPLAPRRLMAFADAVAAGEATLEGLTARRCADADAALAESDTPDVIPLLVWPAEDTLPLTPEVLVDARMRKRREPPVQIGAAPLVIGIGPGFTAGVHAHVVIESNWGERLGAVIEHGASDAFTGRHRVIAGKGAERYLYAPRAGVFRTERALLQPVRSGEVLGWVDDVPLPVEADGIVKGLLRDGTPVENRTKVAEVDPNADPAGCQGIGERQGRIAEGVLEAILRFRRPD